jgi:hypothetical protein
MNIGKKELYVQPALVVHELLRDITSNRSGNGHHHHKKHHHRSRGRDRD